jgi:hypothetical protein
MLRKSPSHWPLAVATVFLAVAIGCKDVEPGMGAEPLAPPTQQLVSLQQKAPAVKPPDLPHKKLVDDWFKIYETALSDLTLTRGRWETQKDENGKEVRVWVQPSFGMSRIARLRGHNLPADLQYVGDLAKLHAIMVDGPAYTEVWAFGAGTDPLTDKNIQLSLRDTSRRADEPSFQTPLSEVVAFAKESLARLPKGELPYKKMAEWNVQSRLMRLTDKRCLDCHVDSRLNDPVAVFVFATKQK